MKNIANDKVPSRELTYPTWGNREIIWNHLPKCLGGGYVRSRKGNDFCMSHICGSHWILLTKAPWLDELGSRLSFMAWALQKIDASYINETTTTTTTTTTATTRTTATQATRTNGSGFWTIVLKARASFLRERLSRGRLVAPGDETYRMWKWTISIEFTSSACSSSHGPTSHRICIWCKQRISSFTHNCLPSNMYSFVPSGIKMSLQIIPWQKK